MIRTSSFLFCVLLFVQGCASTGKDATQAAYQTIGKDPRRDTDSAHALNAKALAAMTVGDDKTAEEMLKQALAADVMFGPAHNNLGKLYYRQKNHYLAAWEFEYAAKLMPYQAEPKNNIGLVFESVGKLNDAITYFDEAMAIENDNAQIIGNAARARCRRGDTDPKVRELLSRLVAIDVRPGWVEWARQRIVMMPVATQPSR